MNKIVDKISTQESSAYESRTPATHKITGYLVMIEHSFYQGLIGLDVDGALGESLPGNSSR